MNLKLPIWVAGIAVSFSCQSQKLKNCEIPYLETELLERREKEQQIRTELMPVLGEYQKTGKGLLKFMSIAWRMERIDEKNQEWLDKMLAECGCSDRLSESAHNSVFLILQHADDDMLQRYFPLVEKKTEKGILPRSDWATMLDRKKMHNNQYQMYGTQTFSNEANENMIWPVEDPDNLEKRREEVGLPTMEIYFQIAKDSAGVEMKWDKSLTLEQAVNNK